MQPDAISLECPVVGGDDAHNDLKGGDDSKGPADSKGQDQPRGPKPHTPDWVKTFLFKEEDDHFSYMEWLIKWSILAEELLAVQFIDEETFSVIFLFLVFGITPMVADAVKKISKCTVTVWDDYAIDVLAEMFQCTLYLYFSSWNPDATPIFVGICIGQIVLTTIQYIVKNKYEEQEESSSLGICGQICLSVCSQGVLLGSQYLLLLLDDISPFRARTFEFVLTTMSWLGTEAQQATKGVAFDRERMQAEAMKQSLPSENASILLQVWMYIKLIANLAYIIYVYVLAIQYLPEAISEKTPSYDEGYIIFMVVQLSLMLSSLCCSFCCVVCGAVANNS
mmetsp:Transcript_12102/g.28503  ORF Transcript_12102/g.28503 Transcript_12102/m.28503 type:complete len:337 (+) Transcript_12102:104-1114(+)